MTSPPSYSHLTPHQWDERISAADSLAGKCRLCPRQCGVNRFNGERGFCKAGERMRISSIFPHHGEEPPLSGTQGSGTVFFSWCTLRCLFCQNFQLSHQGHGDVMTPEELAGSMIDLQRRGCHNINLVTPTHYLPWILRSVRLAAETGLCIPLVYNCGGYECRETLALLDSVVDIYLPDMKYGGNDSALTYSSARDYVRCNQETIRVMFQQVGPLRLDADGVATRGLLIRHLVLPDNRAQSVNIVDWLTSTFDPDDITVSVMAQYRPLYQAQTCTEINRRCSAKEYALVAQQFVTAGFTGYFQESEELDESFVIDFQRKNGDSLR